MFRRKSLPLGVLVMLLVLGLVSLGVGYGLWSKTLWIHGTVKTGSLDAVLSIEEIDELYDFDGICPTGGYSIGQDCDRDGFLNDDWEADDKDIAECTAVLSDDEQTMTVTITEAYPSFNCFIRYDVHNMGSIPIKVHRPVYYWDDDPTPYPGTTIPGGFTNEYLHVNTWPPFCYEDDVQLEYSYEDYCNLHVHVRQGAEQGATYTFHVEIFTHQWNEEPTP